MSAVTSTASEATCEPAQRGTSAQCAETLLPLAEAAQGIPAGKLRLEDLDGYLPNRDHGPRQGTIGEVRGGRRFDAKPPVNPLAALGE